MSTKEALQILATASGVALLSRTDHTKVVEALQTLEKALAGNSEGEAKLQ
jgi:hypothetical protein